MEHLNPRIGITLGDPAGIGPEIVARTLATVSPERLATLVIYGDRTVLERGADHAGVTLPSSLDVVDCATQGVLEVEPGQPSATAGAAQVAYLDAAVADAAGHKLAGLVTAPMNKSTARAADFSFTGHTEFLAKGLAADRVAMMFAGPTLKVVLATTHLPLMEVGQALTSETIVNATLLAAEALRRDFAIAAPRIGVLGLNPHAGEGGTFGNQERDTILPAIELCRRRIPSGSIEGPLVPDAAYRQPFDLFVAMYHDQALIPVKLLDFEKAVNVTLGLPIVRTSPDHGVAYDIAGKGIARPGSFLAALDLCEQLIATRLSGGPSARLADRRA